MNEQNFKSCNNIDLDNLESFGHCTLGVHATNLWIYRLHISTCSQKFKIFLSNNNVCWTKFKNFCSWSILIKKIQSIRSGECTAHGISSRMMVNGCSKTSASTASVRYPLLPPPTVFYCEVQNRNFHAFCVLRP